MDQKYCLQIVVKIVVLCCCVVVIQVCKVGPFIWIRAKKA